MRRFRSVFASGFLFILSACAVGPDFKKPDPPVPAAWVGQGESTTTRESVTGPSPVELVEWWKSFEDPVLTSLVERAIESNLDLRQAEARIRQARATRGVAASALWPEIDATGSYRRTGNGGGSTAGSGGQTASQGGTAPSGNGFRGTVTNLFQVGLDAACQKARQARPGTAGFAGAAQEAERQFAAELPVIPLYYRL
ncbi:MAG: TolC family protein, partial [Syntrophobacteraceae bacterium]|nr:TolC family protein [Syntrophobacteraceae bacterium]